MLENFWKNKEKYVNMECKQPYINVHKMFRHNHGRPLPLYLRVNCHGKYIKYSLLFIYIKKKYLKRKTKLNQTGDFLFFKNTF